MSLYIIFINWKTEKNYKLCECVLIIIKSCLKKSNHFVIYFNLKGINKIVYSTHKQLSYDLGISPKYLHAVYYKSLISYTCFCDQQHEFKELFNS